MAVTMKDLEYRHRTTAAQARALLDRAEKEDRSFNAEEEEQWAKFNDELNKLEERMKRLQEQEARELGTNPSGEPSKPQPEAPEERDQWADARQEFRSFMEKAREGVPAKFTARATLQADNDAGGGYVTTGVFLPELIKFVDDETPMLGKVRVIDLNEGTRLGVPSLDTDLDDADWVSELQIGTEDTSMGLGKRELEPHDVSKLAKISKKLARVAAIGMIELLRSRLGYRFSVTFEKAILTGSGAGQPLGVFTASNDGIPTSRDVATGNNTTSVTADGIINAYYDMKAQYMANAELICHKDLIKQIRKLKDGNGQYLWSPGLSGQPGTILDRPYTMNEFAPNTFTTGQYVGIWGDFRHYWFVRVLQLELQVLQELYAGTNQLGLIGRWAADGMPVLSEAFRRIKLG